ncbi:hypothetical protein SPIRO4BDMA_40398 [uncultured spirochete]|uniref:Uncharacterized protein n=1 Tax=uncultured spirochete TaxID=156406 RepID=A0A3P3XP69_9SPIR|nr:hypothetical protein SPIRO4BDMA_40398 [uncultured spirochete]
MNKLQRPSGNINATGCYAINYLFGLSDYKQRIKIAQ